MTRGGLWTWMAVAALAAVACGGGDDGAKGDPGSAGPPGADGEPGVSAGSIRGTVTDAATGAPIPGASVVVEPGGASATAAADGAYAIADLRIGVYTVTGSASGYDTNTVANVSVIAEGTASADLVLSESSPETGSVAGVVQRRTFPGDPATNVSGAEVALVDALAVAAADVDDPLESLAAVSAYKATTDATGAYLIAGVPSGRYFVHVTPAAADADDLLPGGDASRASFDVEVGATSPRDVTISQKPPAGATYLGSSVCAGCHNGQIASTDMSGYKRTLHALVYRVPGEATPMQDLSQLPDHDRALVYFKDASIEPANDRDNTGSGDEYGLRIAKASFPKFPAAYNLLLGHDGKYFVQFESPSGVLSMKYYSEFTFGGHGVYKERWVTRAATDGSYAPSPASASSYYVLPLQFDERLQPGAEPFHPYNGQNWGPPSISGGPAVRPAQNKSFDNNCAGCHFTGVSLQRDMAGNFRADASHDMNGVLDYDGDGALDEMGIGCESCHGPGSEHVANGPALGKNLVMPNLLSAERSDMICGSCHTRGEGHGTIGGDHTEFPSAGAETLTFPYPGISPAEFVESYHEENPGLYADDTGHSRQHHQQYIDHVRSSHYKNPYQLVTCSDCHDSHARDNGPSLRQPASDNTLCLGCHAPYTFELQSGWTKEQEGLAVSQHMSELADMTVGYDPENMNGVAVATATGGVGECAGCHMPKTAASQSRFMHESVDAQGQPIGRRIRGDVSSHIFDVVLPVQSEVLYTPGDANSQLPNSCGSCHNSIADVSPRYTY